MRLHIGEPSTDTKDVHAKSSTQMLQVRLGKTKESRTAQMSDCDALRKCAFNASSSGVLSPKVLGLLPLARGVERLKLGLLVD